MASTKSKALGKWVALKYGNTASKCIRAWESEVHEKASHSIIIKDHEVFIRIATKSVLRMDCYRELFRVALDDQGVRKAVAFSMPLGG